MTRFAAALAALALVLAAAPAEAGIRKAGIFPLVVASAETATAMQTAEAPGVETR